MATQSQRISFQAFFERAHHRRLTPAMCAEGLLEALKHDDDDFVAWGRLRIFDDEHAEVLPIRIFAEPVPKAFWETFSDVTASCQSHWVDDPDDPEEWASVDWVGGTAEELRWQWNPTLDRPLHKWSALEIEQTAAQRLLYSLLGNDGKPAVLRVSEAEREEFFVRSIRQNLSQKQTREAWASNHPNDSNRDACDELYNRLYLKIQGVPVRRGRRPKIAG